MKLKHKPVSIHTHPVLREYEFQRMKRIWRLGKIASISLLVVPSIIIGCICLSAFFEPKQSIVRVHDQQKILRRANVDDDWAVETGNPSATYSVEKTRLR